MNLKTIIIAIVVLAVAGAGGYLVMQNSDSDSGGESSEISADATSINGLLAQNRNVTCTYSYTDDAGNKSSGTVYIAGERMRGNFTVRTADQTEQKSHTLRDNEYQYVWTEGAAAGFKTKITDLKTEASDTPDVDDTSATQSVDQDQEYDFDCSDWSVDESMFEVPGDVSFTDYSAQLEQAQEAQQQAEDLQEGACAQIADATARAACESAL